MQIVSYTSDHSPTIFPGYEASYLSRVSLRCRFSSQTGLVNYKDKLRYATKHLEAKVRKASRLEVALVWFVIYNPG